MQIEAFPSIDMFFISPKWYDLTGEGHEKGKVCDNRRGRQGRRTPSEDVGAQRQGYSGHREGPASL
jgi:hypothetical protein